MGKWYINTNKGSENMSVNKAIIIGNLGNDPELKSLPSGSSVVNFSVATTEAWNDKATGEKQEKTEWHNVTVFGKQAENANKYLSKGKKVFVEGKIQTEQWNDKDGNKRYTTKIIANNIQFLSSVEKTNEALKQASKAPENYNVKTDESFASDDIPF